MAANVLLSTLGFSNKELDEKPTRTPNSIINQDSDKEFVKISIKVPGLKVKRQMNLQKTPKNGRVIHVEYKKNYVELLFVLNEGHGDEIFYKFTNRDAFKSVVEEEKSTIKFEENTIIWRVHKT